MLIRDCEVEGRAGCDVRISGARIARIDHGLAAEPGEAILEARGGALLPGLHDHHLHLYSLAASLQSLHCGPPAVRDRDALARAIAAAGARAAPGEWLRGVGYHESVAGELDREALDRLAPALPVRVHSGRVQPVRVQHRGGALWMLNSSALDALELRAGEPWPEGVECGRDGRPNGRFFRLDGWLRERLPATAASAVELDEASRLLASFGVCGVTDATPANDDATLVRFASAFNRGGLRQRVLAMGGANLATPAGSSGVIRGARKLVLDERALPSLDALAAEIRAAHAEGRGVAIHCVTRSELVLAAGGLEEAGPRADDRIEHASVAPPDLAEWLARLGVTVVTQPGFVHERGDAYLRDVDARDLPWLYRCAGFARAGVPFAAGTDAPYGSPDPWLAMRAALDRRSESGSVLGPDEALNAERALALFCTEAAKPGGAPRRVRPDAVADLVLLDRPWARAREILDASCVVATLRDGQTIHAAEGAFGA